MTEILPRKLYLGSLDDACDLVWLKATGVSLVLTVANLPQVAELGDLLAGARIAHRAYDVVDTPSQDLSPLFPVWNRLLAEHLRAAEGGAVLVHCMEGVSRSVAAVIAFLVADHSWSLQAALEHVAQRRTVFPNDGFIRQLFAWERRHLPPGAATSWGAAAEEDAGQRRLCAFKWTCQQQQQQQQGSSSV